MIVICIILVMIIIQGVLFQDPEDISLPLKVKDKKTVKK